MGPWNCDILAFPGPSLSLSCFLSRRLWPSTAPASDGKRCSVAALKLSDYGKDWCLPICWSVFFCCFTPGGRGLFLGDTEYGAAFFLGELLVQLRVRMFGLLLEWLAGPLHSCEKGTKLTCFVILNIF